MRSGNGNERKGIERAIRYDRAADDRFLSFPVAVQPFDDFIGVHYLQTRLLEHRTPFGLAESSVVAGIPRPFKSVDITGSRLIFWQNVILHDQQTTRFDYAAPLLDKTGTVWEVVWSDPASNEIESRIFKRKILRIGNLK